MNKYRAVKTTIDGIKFDSKAEGRRYAELKLLERAGEIRQLELQPRYSIVINGRHICNYHADFRYFTAEQSIVEDVKGVRTPVYRLKKKLVEAVYPGIKIVEVT